MQAPGRRARWRLFVSFSFLLAISWDFLYPVVCRNSADRLSGPPFVVVEDPAQPFMAHDGGIHIDDALLLPLSCWPDLP